MPRFVVVFLLSFAILYATIGKHTETKTKPCFCVFFFLRIFIVSVSFQKHKPHKQFLFAKKQKQKQTKNLATQVPFQRMTKFTIPQALEHISRLETELTECVAMNEHLSGVNYDLEARLRHTTAICDTQTHELSRLHAWCEQQQYTALDGLSQHQSQPIPSYVNDPNRLRPELDKVNAQYARLQTEYRNLETQNQELKRQISQLRAKLGYPIQTRS